MSNLSATESKVRVLSSVLKPQSYTTSSSVTKSVKFNSSRYSRTINANDQFIDNEEQISEPEAKKLFDDEDIEEENSVEEHVTFKNVSFDQTKEKTELEKVTEVLENDVPMEEEQIR